MDRRRFCFLALSSALYGAVQPKRPNHFRPFHFPYSTEDLKSHYSAQIMHRASETNARVSRMNRMGLYKPTWQSLDSHPLPSWFSDAKFGMFIDWGIYSVPAYAVDDYPDWYLYQMLYGDTKQYHELTWGKDFSRDDFIPLFTAAEYEPEALVRVAQSAGMRYVIPFAKHHDGFCLWPSSFTLRNAAVMGPKRDLIAPMVEACRKHALKFGFYFSLDEWEYPIIGNDGKLELRTWDVPNHKAGVRILPYSATEMRGKITGKIPVIDFHNQYINPQAVEFIDRYDPDILWLDGDWIVDATHRNSRTLVAYFYNHSEGRKQVVVNDRIGVSRSIPALPLPPGTLPDPHGDFYSSENLYKTTSETTLRHMWEATEGLSSGFGYNWKETDASVRSAADLVHMLVDVVSQGGNLLLITNLTGTGKLDPLMAERLAVVGDWLRVNGEAIYATRQWKHSAQNGDIRFTCSKDARYVYAISLKWPGDSLVLNSIHLRPSSEVRLLGAQHPLRWHDNGRMVTVEIPSHIAVRRATEIAWAFRLEPQPG